MPDDLSARPRSEAPPANAAGPAALYRERIEGDRILSDPAQRRAVERLQLLFRELHGYRRAARRGLLARFGLGGGGSVSPRGIYLWGPVGRGKSMLMDLFFASAPIEAKRRVHFHAFLLEVHDRIERERRASSRQPIARVAADLAGEAALLCFDEFQVNDIADAMILERLFRALLAAGTVVVATSNRPPERLYENGLQRDRFLPFIALLRQRLDIVELDAGRDYRLSRLAGERLYFTPLNDAAHRGLEAVFGELSDGATVAPQSLMVKKRLLHVPRAARNVAWFQFHELCGAPLAAADYLAIADRYAAVILEGIPRLDPRRRNEAARFHILIDTLYEGRTLFAASAEVPPDQIYVAGDGAFEFRRTVSRLYEMQSQEYIANRRV